MAGLLHFVPKGHLTTATTESGVTVENGVERRKMCCVTLHNVVAYVVYRVGMVLFGVVNPIETR